MKKDLFILKTSLNHYFEEINQDNMVIITDKSLKAMLFSNIYTANSFRNLLFNHYGKSFKVFQL